MSETPIILRGKIIDEMSREELIDALKQVIEEYQKRNRMRTTYEQED